VEELLAERGITVDHVTIYRWVQTFTPEFIDAARPARHATGDRWLVNETYVKITGRRIHVLVSARRKRRSGTGVFRPRTALRDGAGRGDHRPSTGLAQCARRVRARRSAGDGEVREQHHRGLQRPVDLAATADARARATRLRAHHRRRTGAFVRRGHYDTSLISQFESPRRVRSLWVAN